MFLLDSVHTHRRSVPREVPQSTPSSSVADLPRAALSSAMRWLATVSARWCHRESWYLYIHCPVLGRADNRCCYILILVIVHVLACVQCVSLAFHAEQ